METKSVELLAPAKDLECGIAAINCGADAVYIGAPSFGAREAAGNSLEDIAALVDYAHKYWARVYVTVNTLLTDDEIPQALKLINQLYGIGIDGLIIQDVGLLECDLPPIPLIASTQMHNDTPEKVAFLEKVGIKRVILARELDLEQIRAIRQATDVELEFFVHGALCVCYSGQCYLSYGLGGRSGNRGQCAQPCRKPYCLNDAGGNVLIENKHLLSLRDLNLSNHLHELISAGVCSFKIEGRLKDKAYVSNIVAYYRAELDNVLADLKIKKSSSGTSMIDFSPDPGKTFNRGYTTYFLNGRDESMGSLDTPKMLGELAGTIVSVNKQSITLQGKIPLHTGDGICFFDRSGGIRGTVVNGVQGDVITVEKPQWIEKGTSIYRNHDHQFLSALKKSIPQRKIGVSLTLSETEKALLLHAEDDDGNLAECSIDCEKALAEKPECALESIRKQLAKSGGTDFEVICMKIDLQKAYFLPISTLNAMRRDTLDRLVTVRAENRPAEKGGAVVNEAPYPEKELSYLGNVLNKKVEAFYRRHGVEKIEPAAESGLDMHGKKVMTTRYCIKRQLKLCPKEGGRNALNEPLYLIDAEGHRLTLLFDCSKCQMEIYL